MKILGISDEVTTCDCCGKKGLLRTIALETVDGDVVFYGCNCAGRAVYGRKSAKNTAIAEDAARRASLMAPVIAAVKATIPSGISVAVDAGTAAAKAAQKSARVYESIDVGFYNWTNKKFIRVCGYGVMEDIPVAV
jgi:hypothetical protein